MSLYDFNTSNLLESRLTRLEDIAPYLVVEGQYAGVQAAAQFSAPLSSALNNGMVSLTGSGLAVLGAIPPTSSTSGFSATSTSGMGAGSSNLHIYWDGTNASTIIVIRRSSGINFRIPGGDLNVTGLNPATAYYFLPFWPTFSKCQIGWVQGSVGTPQIAFTANTDQEALSKQLLQSREALTSGFMSFTTATAGGSDPGTQGGGGGAPGRCVMLGTDIEPLGNCQYRNRHFPNSEWWRVVTHSGRSLNATPNHSVYDADSGKVTIESMKAGKWIITEQGEDKIVESHRFLRVCTKIQTEMEQGHLYWANGILSHNIKVSGN